MNVLNINQHGSPWPVNSELKFSALQKTECGKECKVYINPNSIGVTTCGNRIEADHVIPLRKTENVTFEVYKSSKNTVLKTRIDNQEIISLTNSTFLPNLETVCKRTREDFFKTQYEDCAHRGFRDPNTGSNFTKRCAHCSLNYPFTGARYLFSL